ncbi:centrosome-associated protein CEP250-like [Ruditapes philippinarum]|uniref:centrosome-associated protein CEP250-like n=1 Tax=Ruditapes philippinarum TaxID=129788 RepID=UPI00295AEAE2|nr:centrosome-associated protein CEP250-like [Ruditapes philippinarum]
MLTVKAQFDGVNKENLHLKLQLQSTKDDLKSQKEQLEKSETTTTQLKELLDQMFQQKQLSDAELDASRQSCLQLTEQVQQLHMYEVMYSEASQQLDYLNNTVVPQKDSAIDQLQQKITDLIDEVAVLQRNNIPQAEHYEILQTRLEETRQEHKQYCEDKYGTKMASLERRNEAMKKHVTELETELKNREDVGDELKTATKTYKGLIKENCDLKDKVKTLEKQNKHVAHYKERANNLERQISVLRNRIEE